MSVAEDLDRVAELCKAGARRSLDARLALGPKPDDPGQALLWEQDSTRLRGQMDSLSALVSKLTAAAIIEGLKDFEDELQEIGRVSEEAERRIAEVEEVSELLTRVAKILDLGTALLAAAAAPSPATIKRVVDAGKAVKASV